MSWQMEGTTRGALRRPLLLLASSLVVGLALIADVSGRRAADGYALDVTLPGWPLIAATCVLAGYLLVRWRRARPDPSLGAAGKSRRAAAEDEPDAAPDAEAVTGRNGAAAAHAASTPVERIAVRSPRAITLVAVNEISHIEAAGRYARIHVAGHQHIAQHSLAELERMLDGARFVRVHRSTIVNARRIRSLRTVDYRDFEVLLEDGTSLRLSQLPRTARGGARPAHLSTRHGSHRGSSVGPAQLERTGQGGGWIREWDDAPEKGLARSVSRPVQAR